MNIGEELKQKREDLKITIGEVSRQLKVKESDIVALEENLKENLEENYAHKMTKHLYLSGFIQSYCRLLKISDETTKKYLKNINIVCNTKNQKHQLINLENKADRVPNREYLTNALMIFLMIYLLLISFSQFKSQNLEITDLIIHQLDKAQ